MKKNCNFNFVFGRTNDFIIWNTNNQRFLKYFPHFNNIPISIIVLVNQIEIFADFFLWKAVSRSFRTFLCIFEPCEIYKDLCIKIPTNLDVSFQEMHLQEEGRYSSYFLYNEILLKKVVLWWCFFMKKTHNKTFRIKMSFFKWDGKKSM